MKSFIFCIATILLVFISSCSASFTWSDCGVKLNTNIHYEEASISPSSVQSNRTLSINVKATIVTSIADASTYLTVLKDGQLFESVQIIDLCSIVRSSSVSISCPLQPGEISFTYTWNNVPALITGDYQVKIDSSYNGLEIGCLMLTGHIDGLSSPSCQYTSSFQVGVDANVVYANDDTAIQVGQYGNNLPPNQIFNASWGTFSTNFVGTSDLGGIVSVTNYVWGINGSLTSRPTSPNPNEELRIYYGDLFVGFPIPGSIDMFTAFLGKFNWTYSFDPTRTNPYVISGTFWLNPPYSLPHGYQWPTILGNLGTFSFQQQSDGTFIVSGSRTWCTCGVDACGVCGGDGRSCAPASIDEPTIIIHLTEYQEMALIIGLVGGVLLIAAVVGLYYGLKTTKKTNKKERDQQDLIATPEKPDYGTLALDDVMMEGDRMGEL